MSASKSRRRTFDSRFKTMSTALDKAFAGVEPMDAVRLMEHLAFTLMLEVNNGHFSETTTKQAVRSAVATTRIALDKLKDEEMRERRAFVQGK